MADEDRALRQAAQELAAELRGEHPADDRLAAYQRRELRDDEAAAVRAHLAVCPRCADHVLELISLRRELARRERPLAAPARVAYGLAAALLVAVLGLGLWGLGLRSRVAALEQDVVAQAAVLKGLRQAVAGAPSASGIHLAALRSSEQLRDAGAPEQVVAPAAGVPWVVFVLAVEEDAAERAYRVEIRGQGDRVAWTARHLRRDGAGTGTVAFLLPAGLLPAGDYTFHLLAGGDRDAGRYPVRYAPPA